MQMLAAHLYELPRPMAQAGVHVPADLEAVMVRCLAKEPSQRFENAASLEVGLRSTGVASAWTEAQANAWWTNVADHPVLNATT